MLGSVSVFFFSFLKALLLDKNLEFEKREYKPAKDVVNATLSLMYSLFYGFIFSYLTAKGFDPYIGFLHKKRGTHTVLASDIIEMFRPKLSIVVVDMFNKNFLSREDFERINKSFYFKENSLRKFLKIFHYNFIENKKYKELLEKKYK